MLITVGGIIMRMHADTISKIGRNTKGVRIMRVKDSEIATIAITERDDAAEVQLPEETEIEEGDTMPENTEQTQPTMPENED